MSEETEAARVERTQVENDTAVAKFNAAKDKLTAWAVYNRNTQFIETSGLPDRDAAEAQLTYLVQKGVAASELSVVELPL